MQSKTNRKKPDRIILFEIGLILALLTVNWALNLQYKVAPSIDGTSTPTPFVDPPYVYSPPEPFVQPEPKVQREHLDKASYFDPTAVIKQVEKLFDDKPQKIAPASLPLPGAIGPVVIPALKPSNEIVDFAEVMPQFPGGEDALNKFIQQNLDIPDVILDNGYTVQMVVEFIIDEKGQIVDFKILKCTNPGMGLESAAARLYRQMPTWTPGEHRGGKAKVRLRQPINIVVD